MAGRKREGLDALKDTTGGKRRDDRNVIGKTYFDPISVDAKNALTVIYLLQSPEDNVMLRAVASLEVFGRKDPENLKLLCSLGIFHYVLPHIHHKDYIVRRFTLKLIGMLCKLENFRVQMLKKENILKTFTDILRMETDVVLQEFASLTLAELTSDHHAASELLKVDNCIETLFVRIISADPDVEKNCLDIMNHLLNDINGIEAFVESRSFEIKLLLNLVFSSYPVIQALAIEVLTQLTSWCRDTRVLLAFRDESGIEFILSTLEKEEWADLHTAALDLLVNVTDSPDLCDYLQQSGCLSRLVNLLDNTGEKSYLEKILGVLARMSQSKRGRVALHSVEMEERFTNYLEDIHDSIQEQSCLGIANLAQYLPALNSIMAKDPVKPMIEIISDNDNSLSVRNMAAYALSILSNADDRAPESLVKSNNYESLLPALAECSKLPAELCQNIIQVFIGIAHSSRFKNEVINKKFVSALISCLPSGNPCDKKDVCIQVDALECLSYYLSESEARAVFDQLNGAGVLYNCVRSKFASVRYELVPRIQPSKKLLSRMTFSSLFREWAGHLVVLASQSINFVKAFISKGGLDWQIHRMIKEKNTMYSMPSWQSAIECIFATFLPAKFAYTGRLDFQDVTQDTFYISTNPSIKFLMLDFFFEEQMSPLVPLYVADFTAPIITPLETERNSSRGSQISVQNTMEPQNLKKYMKGAGRNSLEEYDWHGSLNSYPSIDYESKHEFSRSYIDISKYLPDSFLNEQLENLKKKIKKEESSFGDSSWLSIHPKLICERARILAQFVADEMSGPEMNRLCNVHYKEAHITEIKYYLGTNIIPLGLIRVGSYLERAMLFKVLADKIGFPCALVRGCHGRAWIEIAVPVINVEDIENGSIRDKLNSLSISSETKHSSETTITYDSVKSTSQHTISQTNMQCSEPVVAEGDFWYSKLNLDHYKGFSSQFLKPNYIVDLMNEPGRLLKINSLEADDYRGLFLIGSPNEKVAFLTPI